MFKQRTVKHGQKWLWNTVGPWTEPGTNTSGENYDLHGLPSIRYAMKAAALLPSLKEKCIGSSFVNNDAYSIKTC
jgi:hypothetical protein